MHKLYHPTFDKFLIKDLIRKLGDLFMYQSMSEIITLCKQNMGLRDLPKPVTDADLKWRIEHSALKEFSQRYPYIVKFLIGECDRMCKPHVAIPTNHTNSYSGVYQIPKHIYQDRTILGINNVEIQRPNGFNDLYVPQGAIGNPASIMVGLASIQAVGAMARTMTHALTWEFKHPDVLVIYNGWTGGNYEVELSLDHDPSLSTIPPSAFSTFVELCQYDLEEYLYNKLKRVQNLDLGVGSIELKIDDWADARSKKMDLLKEMDETCQLDFQHIQYW